MTTTHNPSDARSDGQQGPRVAWSAAEDEPFNHDTLDDLLDYDSELEPGRTVYFGEVEEIGTDFVRGDHVIDLIETFAYDLGGEHADGFPDLSAEAKEELDTFLSTWQAKHCKPTFYTIRNVKPHPLTDADFEGRA